MIQLSGARGEVDENGKLVCDATRQLWYEAIVRRVSSNEAWQQIKAAYADYRAVFTILEVPCISRGWLRELRLGLSTSSALAPKQWLAWIAGGPYLPLRAPKVTRLRTRSEQLPDKPSHKAILMRLVSFFKAHPDREYAFEKCAGEILKLMDKNIEDIELTRFWRDGGRDGVGKYRIGTGATDVIVDFALEAKCKTPAANNSSGVRETTRLISRMRYRQFGVFITTSCVHEQAYNEILEDGHPVLIIAGADICEILMKAGYNSKELIDAWLERNFGGNG